MWLPDLLRTPDASPEQRRQRIDISGSVTAGELETDGIVCGLLMVIAGLCGWASKVEAPGWGSPSGCGPEAFCRRQSSSSGHTSARCLPRRALAARDPSPPWQLTATKPGRLLLREKGTYVILRELHKGEEDPGVRAACEKVIQVLIGDEPEAGMENLLEVKIPAEVEQQLQRLDLEEEEEEAAAAAC
ncbi:protein HGH1 homolog [Python bivittatus]|uniref:Protein HGH1 homolog n=1 Tax=Python bivittatus TaxID=176946 RepID=A0A9F5J502_PYTBI|nr:protein HGH1 homolog [Python bivittatus]